MNTEYIEPRRHTIGEITVANTLDGKAYVYALRVVLVASSVSALEQLVASVEAVLEPIEDVYVSRE